MTTRRNILAAMLAGFTIDPEELLWTKKKTIGAFSDSPVDSHSMEITSLRVN